jgi:shikimate kinase
VNGACEDEVDYRGEGTPEGLPARCVYLLGFMAAGKTTVGPRLAQLLGWQFVDLDRQIEARAGCTIASMIERSGEPLFREWESTLLREASKSAPLVVAPGGGAILREENRRWMESTGVTIWLDAPFELCWERIEGDGTDRPLARDREAAHRRYIDRLPLYRHAAIRVPIEVESTPQAIAEWIAIALQALQAWKGRSS